MKRNSIIKKLTAVFLSAILLCGTVLFSGCTEIATIDEDCYVNRSARLDFSQSDYDTLSKCISVLASAAQEENVSEIRYIILSIKASRLLSNLMDAVSLSQVYYYSDVTRAETYDVYNDLYSKYNVVSNEFRKLFEPTYHSIYKELFFGDMSDSEIEELLAKIVVSDEVVELNNRIADIQARYNAFTSEEVMGEEHDELFTELIETENAVASYNGYDDYMDYCYPEVYGRDYTVADTLQFAAGLKDNLLSAAERASVASAAAAEKLSSDGMLAYLNIFQDGSFESKENQALLDGFYRSLGNEIYSIYKRFMRRGYYYIAHSENAYEGAFTSYYYTKGEPYIYFREDYATPITFVHEFGHYCNMYLSSPDEFSYELAETHSQGAEWLFIEYLKDVFERDAYSYLVNTYFYQSTAQIFLFSIVGEFEIDVFKADLTAEDFDFDSTINAVTEEIIGLETYKTLFDGYSLPSAYYRRVVVNASGYYISYAVSLVSALQFYGLAQSDYEEAAEAYRKLLGFSSDYQNVLSKVGLSSPFEAETFSDIAAVFAEI